MTAAMPTTVLVQLFLRDCCDEPCNIFGTQFVFSQFDATVDGPAKSALRFVGH